MREDLAKALGEVPAMSHVRQATDNLPDHSFSRRLLRRERRRRMWGDALTVVIAETLIYAGALRDEVTFFRGVAVEKIKKILPRRNQ